MNRWPAWRRAADSTAPEGFPAALEQDVSLLDGRHVHVRPVLPTDLDELRRAVEHADAQTLRARFLGASPPKTYEEFNRLVCVDYDRRLAVVALAPDGQGVGIARYEALGDTSTAEVAVAVDPGWRHIGLATALLRILADGAVSNGIHQFTAEFFADNLDVADLVTEAGQPFQAVDDAGVITAKLSLPDRDEGHASR